MRNLALLTAAFAAAALSCGAARAADVTYTAALNGASQVPPVMSRGTGSAAVTLDAGTNEVSWRVEYQGLSGPLMAAHIHCGAGPKGNAPVAVSFGTALASPIVGHGTMTGTQVADLQAGTCYVNLHTAQNKGGEIRGQLGKAP